jgi:hypothetical protein
MSSHIDASQNFDHPQTRASVIDTKDGFEVLLS